MSKLAVCEATWKFSLFDLKVPASMTAEHLTNADAVAAAGQLGRLDFFSGILAFIALALSIGAFFAYIDIHRRATNAARDAAVEEIRRMSPNVIREFLHGNPGIWAEVLRSDPGIVASALALMGIVQNELVAPLAADLIAEAVGEGGDNEDVR